VGPSHHRMTGFRFHYFARLSGEMSHYLLHPASIRASERHSACCHLHLAPTLVRLPAWSVKYLHLYSHSSLRPCPPPTPVASVRRSSPATSVSPNPVHFYCSRSLLAYAFHHHLVPCDCHDDPADGAEKRRDMLRSCGMCPDYRVYLVEVLTMVEVREETSERDLERRVADYRDFEPCLVTVYSTLGSDYFLCRFFRRSWLDFSCQILAHSLTTPFPPPATWPVHDPTFVHARVQSCFLVWPTPQYPRRPHLLCTHPSFGLHPSGLACRPAMSRVADTLLLTFRAARQRPPPGLLAVVRVRSPDAYMYVSMCVCVCTPYTLAKSWDARRRARPPDMHILLHMYTYMYVYSMCICVYIPPVSPSPSVAFSMIVFRLAPFFQMNFDPSPEVLGFHVVLALEIPARTNRIRHVQQTLIWPRSRQRIRRFLRCIGWQPRSCSKARRALLASFPPANARMVRVTRAMVATCT